MAIALHRPDHQPHDPGLPPLEPGDFLDRATFHARYEAMPPGIKAELIDGVVYMPSPAKLKHGSHAFVVIGWLLHYEAKTPGVLGLENTTVLLSETSEPQPDAALVVAPGYGGQTFVDADDWVTGAPELVVEVASSTAAYDLHAKKWAYEAAGVREYVTILVRELTVKWFVLVDGRYEELAQEEGVFKSREFPGLWLDPKALLERNIPKVLSTVDEGLASKDHAAFVALLSTRHRQSR
jgi:Uma2 family endonuclease